MLAKLTWEGRVTSVEPRIRLTRSFDQRYHTYLGYNLRLSGSVEGQQRDFTVAIGRSAHEKHQVRVGDLVRAESSSVPDKRLEMAEFYKTSGFKVVERGNATTQEPPPWIETPPDLETYRERGHRRLASRTYESKCRGCIWACRMPVEMIIDQWNPSRKRYRAETFCYGPKICPSYSAGPTRKVPGRRGMTWEEADWVDEDATAHREIDE